MAEELIDLGPGFKSRLTWDLINHDEVQEWLPQFGLVPPSEEGLHMAHEEAHLRELGVRPITPLIVALSNLAADIHATYTIAEAEALLEEDDFDLQDDDDDSDPESIYREVVGGIITTGVLAVVSELLQEQVLTIGPGVE